MDKDDFGNRMKFYEGYETNRRFMPCVPVYARIDGRSFSSFTRGMNRPYDEDMVCAMVETTRYLIGETHARIGYTQSDEISLVFMSDSFDSQIFFDGRVQKMVSVLAGLATAKFLSIAMEKWPDRVAKCLPVFDCRVISLPNKTEAANMVLWRERDATKNAITMAASHYYSHKELQGKNGSEKQEMLFAKGINFNDYPAYFKRGTFLRRETVEKCLTDDELARIPESKRPTGPVVRSVVQEMDMPSFVKVINREGVIFDGEDPKILS